MLQMRAATTITLALALSFAIAVAGALTVAATRAVAAESAAVPADATNAAATPAAAIAAQQLAARRVIGVLDVRLHAAEGRLAAARRQIVITGEAARQLRARAEQLKVARARYAALLASLPGSSAALADVGVMHEPFAVRAAAADAAAATAERLAASVTSAAAAEQAVATELARQAAAISAAVDALHRHVHTGLSEFPAHGWGGPGTAAVTPESLDNYLASKASPLAGHGVDLMRSGLRWNVDPRLITSIAGAESLFGLVTCAPYNAWGYGCPNGPVVFASWAQAIDSVAQGLRQHYLDDGLTTVEQIHLRYAPPAAANDPTGLNYAWPNNVSRFLLEQGGNPADVEGPGAGAASAGSG